MSDQKDGEKKRFFVGGNTYEVKDSLRAIGFQWDRAKKRWWREIPLEELEVAKSAIESLGVTVHVEGEEPPAAAKAKPKNAPAGPRLVVGGKTYPVKQEIKELGFRWDRESKSWWRAATADEVAELKASLEALGAELTVDYIEESAPADAPGEAAGGGASDGTSDAGSS